MLNQSNLLFPEECYRIQGAVFNVYREMGCGFLEAVYQECLEKELKLQGIPHDSQVECILHYKGERLRQWYRPDIICFDKIILELKSARTIAPQHKAQLMNYLKATGLELGLLVNFGSFPKAEIHRIAYSLHR